VSVVNEIFYLSVSLCRSDSVGSRVIVLLLSFFRVLRAARLQLYAPVLGHWSPVINSAAVLSSLYGGRVRCVRSYELRAVCTSFYVVTRELRPVGRLLVNCCWFLVSVGRDVCSRPDEPEHCC